MEDRLADCYQIVMERYGIAMYVIGDRVLMHTMRDVCEMDQDTDSRHDELSGVYMIFHEFSLAEIVRLLTVFQAANLRYRGVKIMHTPQNSGEKVITVLKQARKQADLTERILRLKELVEDCSDRDLNSLRADEKADFRETLKTASGMLKSGRFSDTEIQRCLEQLTFYTGKTRKLYS